MEAQKHCGVGHPPGGRYQRETKQKNLQRPRNERRSATGHYVMHSWMEEFCEFNDGTSFFIIMDSKT